MNRFTGSSVHSNKVMYKKANVTVNKKESDAKLPNIPMTTKLPMVSRKQQIAVPIAPFTFGDESKNS